MHKYGLDPCAHFPDLAWFSYHYLRWILQVIGSKCTGIMIYRYNTLFNLYSFTFGLVHWRFPWCSTFLSGKVSHKDVKDSSSWLFRLYYGNRMFMAFCCVSCEVIGLCFAFVSWYDS